MVRVRKSVVGPVGPETGQSTAVRLQPPGAVARALKSAASKPRLILPCGHSTTGRPMTLGAARISARAGVPGAQEVLFRKVDERLRDVRGGPDEVLYLLTDSPQERVLRVPPR